MAEELTPQVIAVHLLLAWDAAWEKYKGRVADVSALPGVALVEKADIIGQLDTPPRDQYWGSRVRSDINLAFRRMKAEGWLEAVPIDDAHIRLRDFGDAFLAVCGSFTSGPAELAQLITRYGGPDLWWWIRTIKGDNQVAEYVYLLMEDRKGRLGFIKTP